MDTSPKARILVVDDEPDIRDLLRLLLEGQGYAVTQAENGRRAVELAGVQSFDLIILDIMMPEMDGVAACQALRRFSTAPVLFLTAKTQLGDKVEAYASGGDDYLPKPFAPKELLVKVDALLRRYRVYRGKEESEAVAEVSLDEGRRCALKGGARVELTDKEYEILKFFFRRPGQILGVPDVYEGVWQEKYMPASYNTVMVHILNLRKKLEEDPANPKLIRTVWGKGYQID